LNLTYGTQTPRHYVAGAQLSHAISIRNAGNDRQSNDYF